MTSCILGIPYGMKTIQQTKYHLFQYFGWYFVQQFCIALFATRTILIKCAFIYVRRILRDFFFFVYLVQKIFRIDFVVQIEVCTVKDQSVPRMPSTLFDISCDFINRNISRLCFISLFDFLFPYSCLLLLWWDFIIEDRKKNLKRLAWHLFSLLNKLIISQNTRNVISFFFYSRE